MNDEQSNAWRDAYLGSACLPLDKLTPSGPEEGLDEIKVKRLLDVFVLEGCRKFDELHRLPVLLPKERWEAARDELTPASPLNSTCPHLNPPTPWTCLRGKHRLAAAYCFLAPSDRWWGVDIYDISRIPDAIVKKTQEGFEHVQPYSDGTIFRKVRDHSRASRPLEAQTWLARLSRTKRRDYTQLLRQKKFSPLLEAFDSLLPFEGLWYDFKIGTFHRLLTMRCTEELAHYVKKLNEVWSYILRQPPFYVDAYTVQCLQGRHPQQSRDDQEYVRTLITAGDAFCWLSQAGRIETLRRINGVGCIIPSLHTFLEDTKWLEPPAKILRRLLPAASRCTLRNGFRYFFVSSSTHMSRAFAQAYRQLWLSALANFADFSSMKPRMDRRTTTPITAKSETEVWYDLVRFCHQLGFHTPVAAAEVTDKTRAIAESAIRSAVPWLLCSAASVGYEKMVTDLAAALHKVPDAPTPDGAMPLLTTDTPESFKLSRRCGRMFEHAYQSNRYSLKLLFVYSGQSYVQRNTITPFAVACHIFKLFFRDDVNLDLDVIPDEGANFLPEASTQNIASIFRSLRRMYMPSDHHQSHTNDDPELQDVEMDDALEPPGELRLRESLNDRVPLATLMEPKKTKPSKPHGVTKHRTVPTSLGKRIVPALGANLQSLPTTSSTVGRKPDATQVVAESSAGTSEWTVKCSLESAVSTFMPERSKFSCCLYLDGDKRLTLYPTGNNRFQHDLSRRIRAAAYMLWTCVEKDSQYYLEPTNLTESQQLGSFYVWTRKDRAVSTTVDRTTDLMICKFDQYGRPTIDAHHPKPVADRLQLENVAEMDEADRVE